MLIMDGPLGSENYSAFGIDFLTITLKLAAAAFTTPDNPKPFPPELAQAIGKHFHTPMDFDDNSSKWCYCLEQFFLQILQKSLKLKNFYSVPKFTEKITK